MTNKQKYINGMNGIKVENELKQDIIKNVSQSAKVSRNAVLIHPKGVMISVACIILLLIAVRGPLVLQNKDKGHPTSLFSGFVVTAYAADGAPIVVKPNIDFPLGQYSVLMSSVPGFPITIACKYADQIKIKTTEGQIIKWNTTDTKVRVQGKEATVQSGETIYWSPLVNGDSSHVAATESRIEITAFKERKKLGSAAIQIKSDEHFMFKGKLTK
ncbi:hypothetical protein I6N90_21370 [Paenibacillus sp. GSMTC-2017]|uniref:hypothetical protein n=1 Tax=Paenibacillus sp. GSMTC-2017 TaxID=2794350 RepID=UPI0018DA267B|nr:hypothetical protein [Paenibacillus sp. GSMTC-2017]MBH5320346.1 hypothetical protein [Paenibacillus sp. GSMTC-2017]